MYLNRGAAAEMASLVRRTTRQATGVMLLLMLSVLASARGQDIRAGPAELPDGQPNGIAAPASSAIEPPRELRVEEADEGLRAREERLWDAYDEWHRTAEAAPVEASDEPLPGEPPLELGVPPQPDAEDGEITLERQEQDGWQ